MDITAAFQQVAPTTVTVLQPGQSAAVYYSFQSRAASSTCVIENAGFNISWSGSDGHVSFPTTPGIFTIEACANTDVTFTQLGPAEPEVFVPGPANGVP